MTVAIQTVGRVKSKIAKQWNGRPCRSSLYNGVWIAKCHIMVICTGGHAVATGSAIYW